MIISCYFAGLQEVNYAGFNKRSGVNHWDDLKRLLSETHHYFVFIITKAQWDHFEKLKEKYNLEEFVHFQMPYFVSNYRYPGFGRKLRLVIFKGKGEKIESKN